MQMDGVVVSGLGRGADYVGMDAYQHRFAETLGFEPFPGTLNLEVDAAAKQRLQETATHHRIEAFSVDGEDYSAVDAYPVTVDGATAALLEMEVTDHPASIAELISPVNLREELGLEDGDRVTCRPR
ncbi:MAG: DUF120 domain-containing protein [Candidatus Nanohaloarchaea archaeon]|nr:DUF120 domain-containing protein [Candidatus Nanohaloarchaea archaeon]